ncbi:hypothetical protein D9M71_619250 [compost metagenome]
MKTQQFVGVGDVQVLAYQCHAEGGVEPFDEGNAYLGDAIMVGITQQGDAVGAGRAGSCALHHFLHGPAAQALAVVGLGWCAGFGHQDVAVGQQV